jgi:hypothetical protein
MENGVAMPPMGEWSAPTGVNLRALGGVLGSIQESKNNADRWRYSLRWLLVVIATAQLDLAEVAQTGVAVAPDDYMVVQYDAERGCGVFDVLGYGDVGLGRGRIA